MQKHWTYKDIYLRWTLIEKTPLNLRNLKLWSYVMFTTFNLAFYSQSYYLPHLYCLKAILFCSSVCFLFSP